MAAASASVNKVLKQLASARGQDLATLRSLYEEANKSLTVLRQHRDAVDPSKRIEIEKAALVVIGHCNDAGLVRCANRGYPHCCSLPEHGGAFECGS